MKRIWIVITGLLVIILAANSFEATSYGKQKLTAMNEEEFIQAVYEGMAARESKIVVSYYGLDYKEIHERFLHEIMEKILKIDNLEDSSDFDYMSYNLAEVGISTKSELLKSTTITITLKWKESKEETQRVGEKIAQVIQNLGLNQLSDYEKVKKIHNYILENVEYDQELECYTAYDALMKGKATCQGYMLLAYRMLTEAGIPAKCLDGMGSNEQGTASHGWNIVKLGAYWYNMDTTWDDPVWIDEDWQEHNLEKEISYEYFLKGNISFSKNHKRSDEFETAEFKEKYPTSSVDYDKSNPVEELEEEYTVKTVTLGEQKQDTIGDWLGSWGKGVDLFFLVFVLLLLGNMLALIVRKR